MATLLLLAIYIVFIGVGIPDSIFGVAWPEIYPELDIGISYANFVTVTISLFTVLSSLVSSKLINRFGTGAVVAFCTALTAVGILGFSVSENIFSLCLFSIPLGFGGGSIDSAVNNYVALHYNAGQMGFLHCFYGIGVSISPYVMSYALTHLSWRAGYKLLFIAQTALTVFALFMLPLWKKMGNTKSEKTQIKQKSIPISELIKRKDVRRVCYLFFFSCGVEISCGTWSSSYLIECKGLDSAKAAQYVLFFYVGLALGRFVCGLTSAFIDCWRQIKIGELLIFSAAIMFILPLPQLVSLFALFLCGFGVGPIFPNLAHMTPKNFSTELSQSVMGVQMASAYTGILIIPSIFGFISKISTRAFPLFILILFFMMIITRIAFLKTKKHR